MKKEIVINGSKYQFKETLRALMEYEKKFKSLNVSVLEEQIYFVYLILKNANRSINGDYSQFTMSYDEFLDAVDDDISILSALGDDDDDSKKKK